MSRKRQRERPATEVELVEIYEDLANIDESVRLKAAQALLSKYVAKGATGDQLSEILRRLIRGLCSGRKAARLGFSIALTELLVEIWGPKAHKVPGFQSITDLIESLLGQTRVSGNVSGQVCSLKEWLYELAAEKRVKQEKHDHQFGRLFGAESIIKSGILFQPGVDIADWNKILEIICALAEEKPWLREECGFVLCSAVKALKSKDSKYSQLIIDKLGDHKLYKTPEGVAIWVTAREECPGIKLPSHVWKYENPLNREEKSSLARILREGAIADTPHHGTESNPSQHGTWSHRIHFAWDAITAKLLSTQTANAQNVSLAVDTLTFGEFWEECVDDSLFASTCSEERRYWGFMLFQKVLHKIPTYHIIGLFTQNFMRCLINQVVSSQRFLHRAADKCIKSIIDKATSDSESKVPILKALLAEPSGNINFDKITKTKTVELILPQIDKMQCNQVMSMYEEFVLRPGDQNEKIAASKRLIVADQLVSALRNKQIEINKVDARTTEDFMICSILNLLAKFAYFDLANAQRGKPDPPLSQNSRQIYRTRISSCLGHLLAKSTDPAYYAYNLVKSIRDGERNQAYGTSLLEVDATVSKVIRKAWDITEKANSQARLESAKSTKRTKSYPITLLYSLTLLQIYNGDVEAVGMLEELNDLFQGQILKDSYTKHSAALIEIILSFASKPSQVFRRLAHQVFLSYTSTIDETDLQCITKVLATKENLSGQGEIFDQDTNSENGEEEPSEASDVGVSISESDSASSASNDSDIDDADEPPENTDDSESPDEELVAFDAKLAQALGTKPGNQVFDTDDTSSSDEDMNDEQMEALDEHLAKVFRERKKLTRKKTERKDAKETVVNFKRRVLELLEVYVKQQHSSIVALNVLLPVLAAIRTTTKPLVSDQACKLIREYSKLCRGDGLPKIEDAQAVLNLLEEVHNEACKEGSNAHASACSQASLLIVRVLVAHDRSSLRRVVRIYGDTQEKALFDSSCRVKTSFFTEWLNWCTSARK